MVILSYLNRRVCYKCNTFGGRIFLKFPFLKPQRNQFSEFLSGVWTRFQFVYLWTEFCCSFRFSSCLRLWLVEQRAMAGPELLLDSSIRMWVVLPIVFITFFVGIIRHYVTQLLHSDKKVDLEQVSDRWAPCWALLCVFRVSLCDCPAAGSDCAITDPMLVFLFSQVLLRSRILRENGKYIPRQVSSRVHAGIFWLVCIRVSVMQWLYQRNLPVMM